MAMRFMFLGPKYLEINLCLCTRKPVCVHVHLLEIFCFLSLKDLITPLEGEAIYSGFGYKNIGIKKLGTTGIASYHQFHIANSYIILHIPSGCDLFSFLFTIFLVCKDHYITWITINIFGLVSNSFSVPVLLSFSSRQVPKNLNNVLGGHSPETQTLMKFFCFLSQINLSSYIIWYYFIFT